MDKMRDIQYIEWCSNKKEFYFLFYFYIWILLAFFTIFLNRFTININSRIMNHAFTMCYNYNILIFWYYYSFYFSIRVLFLVLYFLKSYFVNCSLYWDWYMITIFYKCSTIIPVYIFLKLVCISYMEKKLFIII